LNPLGDLRVAVTRQIREKVVFDLVAEVSAEARQHRPGAKVRGIQHLSQIPFGLRLTVERGGDELLESLPGFGPNLEGEFLAVTGGNLAAFVTAGRLASYAGLVPVPQDSGRISGNLRRPKRYNRRLRRVFYLAALSSLR